MENENEKPVTDIQIAVFMSVISALADSMPEAQRTPFATAVQIRASHFSEKAVDRNGQAVAAILSSLAQTIRGDLDGASEILGVHQTPPKS